MRVEIGAAELLPLGDDGERVGAVAARPSATPRSAAGRARRQQRASPRPSPPGRRRVTVAPRASRSAISTRLGASRMSSVLGLNARPQTREAAGPSRRSPKRATIFVGEHVLLARRSRAPRRRGRCRSRPSSRAGAEQRLARPSGSRSRRSRRRRTGSGSRCADRSRCRGAPARCRRRARSARLRQLVHERDARREHRVGRVLGELGRAHVHHQQALVVALERRVQLAHAARVASLVVGADDDAVGPHEVARPPRPPSGTPGFETTANVDARAAVREFLRDRLAHAVGGADRHGATCRRSPCSRSCGGRCCARRPRTCCRSAEPSSPGGVPTAMNCSAPCATARRDVGGEPQAAGGAVALRPSPRRPGLVDRDAAAR